MKRFIGAAVVAGAAMAASGAAHAEGLSASVNLTSDYVFRGLTQTDGGAAMQGSLDYSSGIFYAGTWGSNVNFGATGPTETASLELDGYAGIRPTTGPITWDLGVVGYFYPNADDEILGGNEFDFYEAAVSGSMKVLPKLTVGAGVNYSPNFVGETGTGWYEEANASFAASEALTLTGAYGHQEVEDIGHYNTWNLGATYALQGFQLGLTYSGASDRAVTDHFVTDKTSAGDRVAVSIGRQL